MKATYSLDRFDLEAAREGRAIGHFRAEFAVQRPVTRAKAKRGVVRGKLGADSRRGLTNVTNIAK